MLTESVAQEIAADTSAIIGFNVLITDRDGIVIGSGDPERVGSFHEASIEVMRTLRAMSHEPAAAHLLTGVLPGVTLPILLDGEAVGTVGITGSPDRVERFGRLVRNQTEVLLRESVLLRSRLFREKAVEDLLRDIAHYDPEIAEPDVVVFRAQELGYDLHTRRVVVVLDVEVPADSEPVLATSEAATARYALTRTVRRTFDDPQDVIGVIGSGRFAVLHRVVADDEVLTRCDKLREEIAHRHGITCRAGVGAVGASVAQLHHSYQDASTALYLADRLDRPERTVHIADLRIHELVAAVGQRTRARFVAAVSGPLREQTDWPVYRDTITAWCESGFNLVRAATALRVHRNTLVYRLHKIDELTGRSTRDARFALNLYLACLADRLL